MLEWREADTGLVRADGEGGAQAGANIVTVKSLTKFLYGFQKQKSFQIVVDKVAVWL